jgi:hypothetical protein
MRFARRCLVVLVLLAPFLPLRATADDLPAYLRDRGPGQRTSMFGTYVEKKQLLVYTFYEYYYDNNLQYSPDEYGGNSTQDYEAKYRANEGLIFLSYGLTDRLNMEMEASVISAEFTKDPNDTYATPGKIKESGLGDVEGQLTYTWLKETGSRPEIYTFAEAVIPHSKEKALIGTEDWEFAFAAGGAKGYGFGTVVASIGAEYSAASETPWDLGETELGWLRRVNPKWLVYAGLEGGGTDELSLITEAQRKLSNTATLKMNLGIGITSNTTDWAPEVGIMWAFPAGR